MPPRIELVATGSELLNGRSVNTHARRLAARLRPLGLALARETTVPDGVGAIAASIREALARASVVIVSGGLGPTTDDCTREAAASVLGCGLREDAGTLQRIAERCTRSGRPLTPSRRRQALVLDAAEALPNPVGAAAGQRLERGGAALFLLPGPPDEFEAVLDGSVAPWLAARYGARPGVERVLMTAGLGESDVAERIEALGPPPESLAVAYTAEPGCVQVRVSGPPGADAEADAFVGAVAERLGPAVYAREPEDLAEAAVRRLAAGGRTLATAESCTGGRIGERITSVPGASAVYRGGVVVYADEAKTALLDVPPDLLAARGAVSAEGCAAMARGVRVRLGADLGLAVTGVAGPGGGTVAKPVGLVFAGVADADGTDVREFRFPFDRAGNRRAAAQHALDLLRRRLSGCPSRR